MSPAIQDVTNEVLESYVEVYSATERGVIVVVLETLRIIGYVCTDRKETGNHFLQGSGHRPYRLLLICWCLLRLATIEVCLTFTTS